jgi:hypothetical protein
METTSKLIREVTACQCGYTYGECTPWVDTDCNEESHYLIEGELADRVRTRLHCDFDEPVTLIELQQFSGYSEYTITNSWFRFRVVCGGRVVEFPKDYIGDREANGLAELLTWLDAPASLNTGGGE